jgi:RHS repeat-associated protein
MARTTVTLLGQEISRSYEIEWTNPVTLGGDACERVTTVRCAVPGADWNAPTSLQTETLRYASGDFEGRLRRELRPDGTGTLVTYSLNTGNGQLTITTLDGQPNPAGTDILAGRRTLAVTNLQGQLVSEHVYRIESTPANLLLSSAVAEPTQYDVFGRPKWIDYDDGTYETRTYACCGLKEERNREGIVTVYDYDALGRRTHTTRAGITLKTTYDAAGRERKTQRYPENDFSAAITLSETDYDLAGRVTATRDAAGRQTDILETVSPSTRLTTTVTTLPGPVGERGTITEIRAADGQLLKRTGSATAAVAYDYKTAALADASSWGYTSQHFTTTTETKLDSAGLATAEVVTTYSDALGRAIKTVYADDAVARSFYNNKGQLIRQTDPDGVQTLQEYNALGELSRTILDVNRDGLVTEVEPSAGAGADRITKTTRSYLTRTDNSVTSKIERTETSVWADQTSAAPTTLAVVDRSVDGSKTWSTTYGLTTRWVTTYGPTDGLRTETVTFPDDSTQVTVYQDGRLQSVTRDSANVQISSVSYGYDDHGRTETVTDARTGTTTYAYYPGTDDLQSVTTPDPDATRSGPGYDSQTTEYTEYDEAGRVTLVTLPDDTQTHTTYWPGGQVKRTWGSGLYPSEYTYDAQGRVKTLTTWQDFAVPTGAATTTWDYDPERGWLIGKRYHDNSGPAYGYKPSGRLETRDWARTLPNSSTRLRTTYTYNDAGDLWTVTYNDTNTARPTPPVTQTYDRLGRPLNTTDAAGLLTRSYQNGRLDDEVYSGAGLLSGQSVSRVQDNLQRLQTMQAGASSLGVADIGYSYDGASRLKTVARGTHVATYGYLANSSLIESVTVKEGSATRLTATRIYDKLNRLTSVTNVGASATRSAAYELDDANRRQRLTREDNAYWDFDYDPLGQVTGATKRRADAAALPGHAFSFDYDDIGNRLTSTANVRTSTYEPTLLNQYEWRTVPGAIDVAGQAQAAATVTVNNQPTQRLDDLFHSTVTVDNSAAAQYVTATVVGVKNNVGANGEDAVSEVTRHAFLAKTPEAFSYDADGNLGADGRWSYEWDAENRLVAMETLPAVAAPTGPLPAAERRRLEFAYDATGRRIRKVVKTWDGSAYATASELRFLYDGWNLVAELSWNTSTSSYSLKSSHVWGLDLSGTAQGAGGVGGLLLSATPSAVHAAAYDGNGNVLALYDAVSGAIAAEYEYGPFGEVLKSDGTAVEANPFGFSTKYRDTETGLNYYGLRYYNPSTGRWLGRDPMEEEGGLNLYGMLNNNPLNDYDAFGLSGVLDRIDRFTICMGKCIEDNDPLERVYQKVLLNLAGARIPKALVANLARAVGDTRLASLLEMQLRNPGFSRFTTIPATLSAALRAPGAASKVLHGVGASMGPFWISYGVYMAAVEAGCAAHCCASKNYLPEAGIVLPVDINDLIDAAVQGITNAIGSE